MGFGGHAGDGNLHPVIATDARNTEEWARVKLAKREMFELAVSMGGTISGEHGIGNTKSKYLDIEIKPGEMELMKGIKALFDPNGILNAGKIFHDAEKER